MPDSGTLLRHRIPDTNENVRVDSGFAEGDVVSSHYDPMISKLIVRSSSRPEAIQVMRAALEKYEVVGPATNIEFLKRICAEPAFVAGDVETGFIDKHRDTLFESSHIDNEVYAQAALGILLENTSHRSAGVPSLPFAQIGFVGRSWEREIKISPIPSDSTIKPGPVLVKLIQIDNHLFDITVGTTSFANVQATIDPISGDLTSFYPHTRLDARVIQNGDNLDVFQQGQHFQLRLDLAAWFEKALGIKDVANSVLTPMPCKVLRVEVKTGDRVKKDQALTVIESMKMETVIRSPHDGVVSKVVHKAGVGSRISRCKRVTD
jgi:3-methylcrotonyl-CoA carboxylase alpha subunit